MGARLSFLRRAEEEARVHGGEIYFDINGKNVGKLASMDCFVDVPAGTYAIRMYKSHNYGTMIGFADATVTVKDGDDIMIRYSMPEALNQPGHIMISDYSKTAADQLTYDMNRQISAKATEDKARQDKSDRTSKNIVKWIIIGAVATGVLSGIIYGVYYAQLISLF